jgi:hypothetical protein
MQKRDLPINKTKYTNAGVDFFLCAQSPVVRFMFARHSEYMKYQFDIPVQNFVPPPQGR